MSDQFEVQSTTLPAGRAFERHFSINEIAEFWALSVDVVRAPVRERAGYIRVGHDEKLHLRRHWTFTIPESVVHREHRRITRVSGKPI